MATRDELSQLIKSVLGLRRGTYLVVNTNDEAKLIEEKPTLAKVQAAISTPERECMLCDTINLRLMGAGGVKDPIVMLVDETGMLDGLPINRIAFYVAHTIKGYQHDIHGTVVIVNDADFGS